MSDFLTTAFAVVGGVFVIALGVLGLGLLFAYPLMLAVNYVFAPAVLTAIFGTSTIGLWKAFCLLFICSTLLKSTTTMSK
jgi:hypothetical protein